MTPARTEGGIEKHDWGRVLPPQFCPRSFPPLLFLTRALKGSFLVMSSSSEDRESISRSILLTFSLGYRVKGQSIHPSPPFPSPPPTSGQRCRGGQREGRTLLSFPQGCSCVAAPPGPPYLWWERDMGLGPSLLQGRRWGREDLLLQRRRGKRFLDRGRGRWEGTSQGALCVLDFPKDGRGR